MKLTKSKLQQIIGEVKEELAAPPDVEEMDTPETKKYTPEFTPFQEDVLETNHRTIFLLQEMLAQLKTLNHFMTPAKGLSSSGEEKALAGVSVAEGKVKK